MLIKEEFEDRKKCCIYMHSLKLPTGSHVLILVDLLVQANKIQCTPCSLTIFYWPPFKWLHRHVHYFIA